MFREPRAYRSPSASSARKSRRAAMPRRVVSDPQVEDRSHRQQGRFQRERCRQADIAPDEPSQRRRHELPRRHEPDVPEDHRVLELRARDQLGKDPLPRRLLEGRHGPDHGREREHRPQDRDLGGREHDVDHGHGRRHGCRAEQQQPRFHPVRHDPAQQCQEHPRQRLDDERPGDDRRQLVLAHPVADEQRHRHDLEPDAQRHRHRRRQPGAVAVASERVAGSGLRGGLVAHAALAPPVLPPPAVVAVRIYVVSHDGAVCSRSP